MTIPIHGLQKMTLLDYLGKVACTVFLGGCDLRCPCCHNSALANGSAAPLMNSDALMQFLEKRRGRLDGVAITGGEPLLQDIGPLLREIKRKGFLAKLDTNGFHPSRLRALLDNHLIDYVAVDIKNSPTRYAETVGLSELDLAPLYETIEILREGMVEYEFRTTIVQQFHSMKDFEEIGRMICGARKYFLQPFVDRDTVPVRGLNAPSAELLREIADTVRPYVDFVGIRGETV